MQKFQGDISLIQITEEKLPKDLIFKKMAEDVIVALGETTGHRHTLVVERENEQNVEIAEDKNGWYVKVNKGNLKLTHDKHSTQVLTPSPLIWFVGKQEEYMELGEWRRVSD